MASIEFWVCKVLMHQGPPWGPMRVGELKEASHQTVMQKIIDGELGCLQSGEIIEPIEQFSTEEAAHEKRTRLTMDSPADDFRVVLNMEVKSNGG